MGFAHSAIYQSPNCGVCYVKSQKILLAVLPVLLFVTLIPACTNDLPVDGVEDEVQSLLVMVEVQEQVEGIFSWSQPLRGNRVTTSAFIESLETIIPQFQKQVPVSATVRVLKGDEVLYDGSFSSESTQEEHPLLFVSGISAFVSKLSETLGLETEPYVSKTSKILREVWVVCCVVGGQGGYCWGYEGNETYEEFIGMDAQQYACLCNGSGCW